MTPTPTEPVLVLRFDDDGPDAPGLDVDPLTWLHVRMGRRNPEEMRELAWRGTPSAELLGRLPLFGPTTDPLGG